jgi:hypothetical protein
MSVPVIIIDDQIILGFNQSRIDELLAKESPGTVTPPPAAPTPPADVKPPEV